MERKSLFYTAYPPLWQAAAVSALALVVMLIACLLRWVGWLEAPPRIFWMISGACMLYYAIFNSIFSLSSNDFNAYFLKSLMGYVLVAGICSLAAWLFSGQTIDEAGSFRWIYFILTFSFILFLGIVNGMRRIVAFAQKEDKRMQDNM